MQSGLQLNSAKTKILWSTTSRRLHQLPQTPLRVGSDHVAPALVVRDFEIYLDSDLTVHEVTCRKDRFRLLRGTAPVTECPPVSSHSQIRSPVVGDVTRHVTTGLRQCNLSRHLDVRP